MAGNLLRIDNGFDDFIKHVGFDAAITECFSTPDTSPTDLTWDGTNLYSADNNTDDIYKHTGFSSSIDECFSAPGATPYGLAWDGTDLLSSDISLSKIYQHTGFSDAIDDSFSVAWSFGGFGLAWDGTNLISGQGSAVLIFKHTGFSGTILDSLSTYSWPSPGWDGANLLIGFTQGADRIYQMTGFSESVTDSFTVIYAAGVADGDYEYLYIHGRSRKMGCHLALRSCFSKAGSAPPG